MVPRTACRMRAWPAISAPSSTLCLKGCANWRRVEGSSHTRGVSEHAHDQGRPTLEVGAASRASGTEPGGSIEMLTVPGVQRLAALAGNRGVSRLLSVVGVQRQDAFDSAEPPQVSSVYQDERVRADVEKTEQQGAAASPPDVPKALAADVSYYEQTVPAILAATSARGIDSINSLMVMAQAQSEHSKSRGLPPGNMIFGITTNETDPIKYVRVTTTEVNKAGIKVVETGRKFRRYDSAEASVEGYLDLLGGKDKEFPAMYPGGVPLAQLQKAGANPNDFLQAMLAGGYTTNPEGAWQPIKDVTGAITGYTFAPGYREVYPSVYNQIVKDLKKVLPIMVGRADAEVQRISRLRDGLSAIADGIEQKLNSSSMTNEDQLRADLGVLRNRIAGVAAQLEDLRQRWQRLTDLANGIVSAPVMPPYRSPVRNRPPPGTAPAP